MPAAMLTIRRSAPGAPTETTFASPPSVEPAPSATELTPVDEALLPSATLPAWVASALSPTATEAAPDATEKRP
jgi:hypothetical protein